MLRACEDGLVPIMLGRALAISMVLVRFGSTKCWESISRLFCRLYGRRIYVYDPCVYAFVLRSHSTEFTGTAARINGPLIRGRLGLSNALVSGRTEFWHNSVAMVDPVGATTEIPIVSVLSHLHGIKQILHSSAVSHFVGSIFVSILLALEAR